MTLFCVDYSSEIGLEYSLLEDSEIAKIAKINAAKTVDRSY